MEEDNESEHVTGSPTAGENGFVHIESVDSAQIDGGSINQAERLEQDDGVVVTGADTVQYESQDARAPEDGGHDEFVDCPDDLVSNEARSPVVGNRVRRPTFGDNTEDNTEDSGYKAPDVERETSPQDFELLLQDERRTVMKEVSNLHHQLKTLNMQQSSIDGNDVGVSSDPLTSEMTEDDEKSLLPLRQMINECSKFIELSLNGRSQAEGTVRELYATLHMKDKEIEDLMANSEHSIAQDAARKSSEALWVEATVDRILSSLTTVLGDEEFSDTSVNEKLFHVEKSTSLLLEKYHHVLSEVEMLSRCLAEVKPDFSMHNGMETVFLSAREELFELKRKALELSDNNSHLEDQYRELMQQLDKGRETVEMLNAEIGKLKGEVEQEKTRYGNTKEKLSMAVTKGKALVQQRDSLKQSVAEKTSELERCVNELQEKSSALEAAQLRNDELMRIETFANSLQEALAQRDMLLGKCGEILSLSGAATELQSLDIIEGVTWLANERNRLAPLSWEYQRLLEVLSSQELPEMTQFPNLESQVSWLLESYNLEKHQNVATREAARSEIDRLTASLLVEAQEKYYLKEELEELTCKYEGIVKEKDQMMALLLDFSGISIDGHEDNFKPDTDMAMVINRCFSKIKEQIIASPEPSLVDKEVLEKIQTLLYVRTQECMMYGQILEEEKMCRLELDSRSNEIGKVSEELRALKDEKSSLQTDHQRSEEKASLLREKLSLAVKKGKGLVQERENMKQQMAEKNAQIETLKLELQKQESTVSDCRGQIDLLSTEVKSIAKLESDLLRLKEERDQIEQFLVESNTILQQVMETIDGIILPVDLTEPVEKVKWFATYLRECEVAKGNAEQELGDVKGEAHVLASKLTEALTTMKSLEDAVSVSEKNASQLAEEKRELEISKTYIEKELQNATEEYQVSKTQAEQELQNLEEEIRTLNKELVEALTTLKSLEDALSGSEKTVTDLSKEKRDLEFAKSHVEGELRKAIEEATSQTSKLQEAFAGKNSLEEALSVAQNKISMLMSEREEALASKVTAEMELEKAKDEVSAHAINLDEAYKIIKSLEDAMSQLKTNVSQFSQDNEKALKSEIKKFKEEAEYHERKVVEASATVKTLQDALVKAENTVSDLLGEKKSAEQEISALNTELSVCRQELAGKHDKWASELSAFFGKLQELSKDGSVLALFKQSFEKKIESFKEIDHLLNHLKDNLNSEQLQEYPAMEESFLSSTFLPAVFDSDWNTGMTRNAFNAEETEGVGSYVAQTLDNLNIRNQILVDQFRNFSTLIDEMIASLLKKLEAIRNTMPLMAEQTKTLQQSINSMQVDKESLIGQFLSEKENMSTRIQELQVELEKTRLMHDKAKEENDVFQKRVPKLETDLEASGKLCNEMSSKLEDYRTKEAKPSVQSTTFIKDYESESALLSASQVKSLFAKIDRITIPFPNLVVGDIKPQDSDPVTKLFYIVDSINELLDQTTLLTHAKDELRSTLSKQSLEIDYLKREIEETKNNKHGSEKMEKELFELSTGLQNIIQELGGDESFRVKKSTDIAGLFAVLERLVQGVILNSENSKSKAQDLGAKLVDTQKVAEELASKVRLLEDFNQSRAVVPDTIQERASLPARSEISEIEDQVPVAKVGVPLVPSAAHMRSLRKGSNDQLAITIDSESDRLVDKAETIEDKGRIFKSLHTSGLVPVKGKMIADRLDGIWVSSGQALMRRPRARLGLIAYWLVLHLWLLGTIL